MSSAMAAQDDGASTPPDGPPTSVSVYIYGADLTGVQWTNGDTAAHTEVGYRADTNGVLEPTSSTALLSPGVTSWESGSWPRCHWWVRHLRNGTYTAWVLATNIFGCSEEPLS